MIFDQWTCSLSSNHLSAHKKKRIPQNNKKYEWRLKVSHSESGLSSEEGRPITRNVFYCPNRLIRIVSLKVIRKLLMHLRTPQRKKKEPATFSSGGSGWCCWWNCDKEMRCKAESLLVGSIFDSICIQPSTHPCPSISLWVIALTKYQSSTDILCSRHACKRYDFYCPPNEIRLLGWWCACWAKILLVPVSNS